MSITHEEIMQRLISEAVDDQPTGWLSDNEDADVYAYDKGVIEIRTYNCDYAHVDVSHLASIVLSLIEENR